MRNLAGSPDPGNRAAGAVARAGGSEGEAAAAAAIGLSLSMGITTALRVPRRWLPLAILAGTFVAIGPLHQPLVYVVLGAGAGSIALEWLRLRRAEPARRA